MIFCDNMSAIKLAKNLEHYSRRKPFDMKHHFIQDLVKKIQAELKYINAKKGSRLIIKFHLCLGR